MAENLQGDDRFGGFGRNLYKFISNKLPYSNYELEDKFNQLNPKFKVFHDQGSGRGEALVRQSISSSTTYSDNFAANIYRDLNYHQFMYANIQGDKPRRLMDYRIMAAFAEVADALDEICDETINKDENGEILKLTINFEDLDSKRKTRIEKEFQKYINYFDLEHSGWEYFRRLLVEGELYFEHIIHKEYTGDGILGILNIPTELCDPLFSNVQNMLIKGYLLRKPVLDAQNPTKVKDYVFVPFDKNQITYINSGIWNENKTIRLPFIENARRAYRQLSLIEDSIVIYRLVRAPEKLVFNVDVGNLPPAKAEAYLQKLMRQYWSKKTYDTDQAGTVQKFNPQSMLDSFWFAKRANSEGTNVTQLEGGQNLGELTDLMYFVKKLYKALKVPVNRLDPADKVESGENILREELKFAKFVIRLQERFAVGLKNGFITHLRMRGLWEEYNLKEQNIDLAFNPPTNFYELRQQQKLELKANNFNLLGQNDSISKTYAQKKYLGWNDNEIKANREFLRKDKEFGWELAQIESGGPEWQLGGVAGAAPAGGAEAGAPPAFGPGAAGGAPAPTGAEAGGAEGGTEAGGAETGGAEAGGTPAPAPGGTAGSALP
jgi:hypothetical protein